MARNKQTTSTSHTDSKASTTDRCFRSRDTYPNPKFHHCLRFHFNGYTSSNTVEHPDIPDNVSELGGTETSTNSR